MAFPPTLFPPEMPPGFRYREDIVSVAEECVLLNAVAGITFSDFEMRGVVARRRVAFFGQSYDGAAAAPIPEFLLPLRLRVAEWAGLPADAFAMVLINEYPPDAPIGWHRDAPQYGIVAGISLASTCRIRFRPYRPRTGVRNERRKTTHEMLLGRRSAYLLAGESRNAYEHHIPPVAELRYSVTFRTLRK